MKQAHLIQGTVTMNDKGQVVIPADARALIDLQAGDKLLVLAHPCNEALVLMKPDRLEATARQMLEQVSDTQQATE